MNWKIEKQKIWKLTGGFFAAMAAFTLLSRAAYQHGIAVVTTQAPASGTISHQVVLNGKTVQNQEQAVTTEAGLRIAGVYVNEGQQVKQGDVLFTLDLDYLDEEILHQKQEMQKQMYPALQKMFDDMRAEGVYPIVASGYRSEEEQQMLLEEKIQQYRDQGYSLKKAREAALLRVAEPGTSEHQLGLAVDINQEGTRSTAAQVYAWLEQHAWEYGFILRYPEEKSHITGITKEPWHYRYVGQPAAAEIYQRGITLEEYLDAA